MVKHIKYNGKTFYYDKDLNGGYFDIDYASNVTGSSKDHRYVYNYDDAGQMFFNIAFYTNKEA